MSFRKASNTRNWRILPLLCLWAGTSMWLTPAAYGQSASEWLTSSGDAARDGWQKIDGKITTKNVKKLQMLWKVKVEAKTVGMQSFREPLIVSGVKTAEGARTVAIFAAAANQVFAVDAENGKVIWKTKLKWSSEKPEEPGEGQGFICTNALSATPVVSPIDAPVRRAYVVASDGYLHILDLSTGEETEAAIQVMSLPYGKPYGLNLVNNVIYTVTGQGCGGVLNLLYAVNLANKKLIVSSPPQAGLWGTAGPSVGSDGTIYFESGDGPYDASLGKLSTSVEAFTFANDQLTLKDYYSPSNHIWLSRRDLDMNITPVIFPYKGRDLVVGSGKEGRYFVMDSKSLGGTDHMTPLFRSELYSNKNVNFQTEGTWGSLASWEEKNGTRWVLGPTGGETAVKFPKSYGATPNGGIIALKLKENNGKTELEPAWQSVNMMTSEPPVIVNGVAFVLAGGEFTGQANDAEGGLYSAKERIERSVPAKLYALDAVTGKELYSSGNQITSFLHQAGLSVAQDKVMFGTFDGTIYCFGLK
ncbi:MAG TPA: PQQ-binding-like beta-propeller repeat protein [Terriglobales bacterium]|nr:PQQ-binding-like beta-propeller repeat protein [Terriglobales bacterium]